MKTSTILLVGAGGVAVWLLLRRGQQPAAQPTPVASVSGGDLSGFTYNGPMANLSDAYKSYPGTTKGVYTDTRGEEIYAGPNVNPYTGELSISDVYGYTPPVIPIAPPAATPAVTSQPSSGQYQPVTESQLAQVSVNPTPTPAPAPYTYSQPSQPSTPYTYSAPTMTASAPTTSTTASSSGSTGTVQSVSATSFFRRFA